MEKTSTWENVSCCLIFKTCAAPFHHEQLHKVAPPLTNKCTKQKTYRKGEAVIIQAQCEIRGLTAPRKSLKGNDATQRGAIVRLRCRFCLTAWVLELEWLYSKLRNWRKTGCDHVFILGSALKGFFFGLFTYLCSPPPTSTHPGCWLVRKKRKAG